MLKIVVLWILLATAMSFAFGAIFVSTAQAPVQAQQAEHYEPVANQQDISLRQRLAAIWARTWEDSVAFYAFVLSIFTALLVFVSLGQTWFLISTGKTARVSADAAKQAANAAMAGQRAYVVDPQSAIKKEFEDVKAKKTIAENEKKRLLSELNAALESTQSIIQRTSSS